MRNTIKITNEAKESLDWIKTNFSFTNFSIAIETCCVFFKNNSINPREVFINNFSNSIFELKKELLLKLNELETKEHNNTERVIKINRRIEEDLLKPASRKINDIYITSLKEYNKTVNENTFKDSEKIVIDNSSEEKVNELKKVISTQDNAILEYKALLEKQENLVKEYFRCMKTLNQNMKVENTTFGKKIFINLPLEDAEKLFYLIP